METLTYMLLIILGIVGGIFLISAIIAWAGAKVTDNKLREEEMQREHQAQLKQSLSEKRYNENMEWSLMIEQRKLEEEIEAKRQAAQLAQEEKEKAYQKEIKMLKTEARATAFKRTPKIREKIVSDSYENIIKNEQRMLDEYRQRTSRPDIEEIENQHPEIMEMWREPLVLLEQAWEKYQGKTYKKLSPDEWRDREVRRVLIKAKDNQALKNAGLQELISEIEQKKEAEQLIRSREDLTEEEKDEYIDHLENIFNNLNLSKGGEANDAEMF